MKYEGTKLSGFEPRSRVEKLEIIDTDIGEGEEVKPDARITVHYTGALAKNGIIFQSSHDGGHAITCGLNQVIKGWTQGVPGMRVGGTRRLIIPSEMAYGGASPANNIPSHSDLVFDIDLVEIKS
jgi:peptidylprolyl isomerase